MTLKRTPCCALLFMIAKDWDNLDTMYRKLEKKSKQLAQTAHYGYGRGETTIQCVVLPTEKNLKKNLLKLGFKKKVNFDRRKVSCQDNYSKTLSLYILELKNLKRI